ncbi:MAG: trypsin-like serine protease, partial [Deltaproteobacteria bacterium]
MNLRTALVASTFTLASLTSTFGHAQSAGRLWAERGSNSAPLAQVPDFRTLAQALIPTVVSIQVEQRVKQGPHGMPQEPLDYFHRYFGGEVPREFHNRGLGSGFIIDPAGLILTNYHVVEDAEAIEVTVAATDGSERKVVAKILGTAPEYDVALLQTVETLRGAGPVYLGDSDNTQIGDWVMAVGNPFGLTHSVSVG